MFVKVAFITVFVFFLHQGDALKCYLCTSATDPSCMDKVGTIQMTKCSAEYDLGDVRIPDVVACVKLVKKVGDKKIVQRGCEVRASAIARCEKVKALKDVDFCGTCDTDGCNGSSVLAPSAVLFLLVAALVTLMARQ